MRDIKFRVWDGNKIHHEGYSTGFGEYVSFYIGLDGVIYLYEDDDGGKSGLWEHNAGIKTDEFKIMQYTELKDKNGKEIYEGDICKCNNVWNKAVVEYWEESAGYVLTQEVKTISGYDLSYIELNSNDGFYAPEQVEVIGNIYENPELLE